MFLIPGGRDPETLASELRLTGLRATTGIRTAPPSEDGNLWGVPDPARIARPRLRGEGIE